MAWYGTSSNTWQRRHAIAVVDTSGSPGSFDVTFPLGAQHAEFWENVQSDGYDILVTQADGVTLIDHKRLAWNYSAKTATIELDNAGLDRSAANVRIHLLWIYFDTSSTVTSDPAASFTASSPLNARVWPGKVNRALTIPPASAGDTQPRMIQQKSADDENQIMIDCGQFLDPADAPINNSSRYDEICWIQVSGETGTSTSSLWDSVSCRYDLTGRFFRSVIQSGSSGTDYTQWARVGICNPDEPVDGSNEPKKVYDQRFIVKVKNTVET